jgi:hypothetical protein
MIESPLEQPSRLNAPAAGIELMLAEIDFGRN